LLNSLPDRHILSVADLVVQVMHACLSRAEKIQGKQKEKEMRKKKLCLLASIY